MCVILHELFGTILTQTILSFYLVDHIYNYNYYESLTWLGFKY